MMRQTFSIRELTGLNKNPVSANRIKDAHDFVAVGCQEYNVVQNVDKGTVGTVTAVGTGYVDTSINFDPGDPYILKFA